MKYEYPKNYKVKPIKDQVKILNQYFPKLNLKAKDEEQDSLVGAEGIFAIPHWNLFGTYNDAIIAVSGALEKQGHFYNYRNGELGPEYLRQTERKEKWWNTQKDNVVLLSAQTGIKYAGKSIEQARKDIDYNEFLLGAYEGMIISLTHEERFERWEDLGMDLGGDEYSYNGGHSFSGSIRLYWRGGRRGFGRRYLAVARDDFGSGSGFVPQNLNLDPGSLETFESSASLDASALKNAIDLVKKEGYMIFKPV